LGGGRSAPSCVAKPAKRSLLVKINGSNFVFFLLWSKIEEAACIFSFKLEANIAQDAHAIVSRRFSKSESAAGTNGMSEPARGKNLTRRDAPVR